MYCQIYQDHFLFKSSYFIEYQVLFMLSYFIGKQPAKEAEKLRPFSTKSSSELQKLKQLIKADKRTEVPRDWFEIVLEECLGLMNFREAIKLACQYKVAVQQGIDEEENKKWNSQIQQAKKKLVNTNYQLFDMFQIRPKLEAYVVEEEPIAKQNLDELGNQLASLNQTRQTINLLSELIGKALNHQQVQKEVLNIQKMIPKEMENMLILLKSYLSLKQSERDFLKKLKKIDQDLILEKEHMAPIEDPHDGLEINNIYERISTFLEKNKTSLANLRIFNQEIVDSLRDFIRQILQPLQKQKEEEKDVINILTNIGDVKHELQRVLASYKEYIQVNDQNSQEIEIKLRNYKTSDEELKEKNIRLEKDNNKKDDLIDRLTQEIQGLKRKLADAEQKLKQQNLAHSSAQNELDSQNKVLKDKLRTIKSKLSKLNLQRDRVKSDQTSLLKNAETLMNLKQDVTKMMEMIKKLINSLNQTTQKLQHQTSLLEDSKRQTQRLKKANEDSALEMNLKALQLEKARVDIENYEVQLKRSEQERSKERTEYDEKIKNLTNDIQKLTLTIEAINKSNSTLKLDINEMRQRQAAALRENEELLKKIHNQRDYQRYFAHDILFDFNFYKKPIIDVIENRNYLGIRATRLLFRFDPLNKTNFHRYVDEIPHILILVKLENGRMLACYTNQPFKPQSTGEDAFIMVLNTGNIYELKKGAKAISYDEYYLLFGNSEIRLRSGEQLIFSNFGIANSNFDNKGQGVDALFGEGKDKRELPIAGYEIYQIIFEEER